MKILAQLHVPCSNVILCCQWWKASCNVEKLLASYLLMIRCPWLPILRRTLKMLALWSGESTQLFCWMSTKTHHNHRCGCCPLSMVQAIRLWLWETHHRLFIHGAEPLPAPWPLSISTSQRRKDKLESNSSHFQQPSVMTQSS